MKPLSLLTLLPFVGAKIVPVTLNIANKNLAPDGFVRSTVVANGQYPGPPIVANKGDRLLVTVNNRLTDPSMRRSTSLNFDGVFIDSAHIPFEGTPFVSSCPVAPGGTFTHDIPLDPNQAGTFWYHSQLSVQYIDGLRGPLIIYDPKDPHRNLYDVDDLSTVIQIGDWWHNTSTFALDFFRANDIIPVTDTGTINGAGRFNGGPAVPFSVVNVVAGKRYRLRVINESGRSAYNFSIDSHNVTVIETDGVSTTPLEVNTVPILAGQRYSLVLNANQPVDNYWINAPFSGGAATRNPGQNVTFSRAILRYRGAPAVDPTAPMTAGPSGPDLRLSSEAVIAPLVADPPPPADIVLEFSVLFTPLRNGTGWAINNISYLSPQVPTLVKVLQQGASDPEDFNVTEHTIVLPQHKTVEVRFPSNDDDELHPFHMHGMNFWVVKPDTGIVENDINPIIRDVTGAGAAGTIVRFRTDKVGPFFYHCHIMWHMASGLGSVMLVDPAATRATIRPNAQWKGLCPAYDRLPADQK